MADLILKGYFGQTMSKVHDIAAAVATGMKKTIGNVPMEKVVAKGKGGPGETAPEVEETGYVEESVLAELTESTVQIPQNFAGLESVMTPTRLRNQFFEISEVTEYDGYIEVTALHMFYRMRQNMTLWEPNENTKYSGASAIRNVMANALFEPDFKVASDSTDLIRGNELDYARMNIVEAFLNPESGICARYGLSLIRDNDVFYCLKDVGYDRGFVVQNGKNMLGVERTESIEDIITRVAPVGRDEDGEFVWLNRNGLKYIDSPHIGEYATPRAEIYVTDLEIGRDDVTAANIQDKLYEAAQKRFTEDEVDIPTVSMTVQFISLGDTEEYKQYKDLDKVYLYDVIHIKDTERGYSYGAQVIAVQHNILTGLLESVTIGTPQPWDGVRKIGAWQVPEITGGKLRHGSVRSSELADGAVREDKIAPGAIVSGHMSQSADGHFKTIFAEELYISNTSEDGLLNTRFTVNEAGISGLVEKTGINSLPAGTTIYGALGVEAGKVAMVVGTRDGQNYIKAAEISTSINEAGEGVATINGAKIMIGNQDSVTVINGKCSLSDVTAQHIQTQIMSSALLSVQALASSGGISATGFVSGNSLEGNSLQLGGSSCTDLIKSASVSGNTLTLTYLKGGTVTFSKATTLSGAWGSGVFTATAQQNGVNVGSLSTSIFGGAGTWNGKTVTIPIYATIGSSGTSYSTGKSVTATYTGSDYDQGWNDALDACGFTQGYFYAYATPVYLYPGPMIPAGNGQNYPLADGYKTVPARR